MQEDAVAHRIVISRRSNAAMSWAMACAGRSASAARVAAVMDRSAAGRGIDIWSREVDAMGDWDAMGEQVVLPPECTPAGRAYPSGSDTGGMYSPTSSRVHQPPVARRSFRVANR
jgi:hypothetical protein